MVVITASVGRPVLRRCAESVQRQEYSNVRHLVVVDGPDYAPGAGQALENVGREKQLELVVLPWNTGRSSYFGHRIYGAIPMLVDDDIVCYLDEDNWLDPEHLSSAIDALRETRASWAYSLRRICTAHGAPICDDDADSLGYWPRFATRLPDGYVDSAEEMAAHLRRPNLVDTSCYILARELACTVGPLWQKTPADSTVSSFLVRRHVGVCTGRSTVNYALGGGSDTPERWFTDGNRLIGRLYGGVPLPWRQPPHRLGPGSLQHPTSFR